jgi:hypothetical protein
VVITLLFSSCQPAILYFITAPNTKTDVQSKRISNTNLTQKRVLIVTYDSSATRELLISLKNYLNVELVGCKVISERINIRQNEDSDLVDFEKLKTSFNPDYLMTINFEIKRTRDFYIIGDVVKKIRDITFYFNLKPYNSLTEQATIWKGEAAIKHLYDEGHTAAMKKIANKIRQQMQKDLIIK